MMRTGVNNREVSLDMWAQRLEEQIDTLRERLKKYKHLEWRIAELSGFKRDAIHRFTSKYKVYMNPRQSTLTRLANALAQAVKEEKELHNGRA